MHCFGCSRVGKRICASSAFAVSLMAFLQSPHATAAGISYAAHVVSMSRGQGAVFARMDGRNSDWIARVAFAHGRGRADFVSGQSVLRAGDHLLFDSADAVVVHDSTKTYTIISRNYLARLSWSAYQPIGRCFQHAGAVCRRRGARGCRHCDDGRLHLARGQARAVDQGLSR